MKLHQNIYLPDREKYLVGWMSDNGEVIDGKGTYQIVKLRAALEHCKSFRTAIDVGAHVGLWTLQMQKAFARVEAFEPVQSHYYCLTANLAGANNVGLHSCALGNAEGVVSMKVNAAISCKSRVDKTAGDIPLRTLDSYGFTDVDFIKIDTEGYELPVVRGAEHTIKKYRPTMIVEQKGHAWTYYGLRKEAAVELLESWGMIRQQEIAGDYIMVWPC